MSFTLREAATAAAVFYASKKITAAKTPVTPTATDTEKEGRRINDKMAEIKESGGAKLDVISTLKGALLARGIDTEAIQKSSSDPVWLQAKLAIMVEETGPMILSTPASRNPFISVGIKSEKAADVIAGWKRLQHSEVIPMKKPSEIAPL